MNAGIGWSWEVVAAIGGLALVTLVTRAFFLLPEREVPLPQWLRQGLRYAPLAALTAVVAPEVVMHEGRLITTLQDARPYAAIAGALWFLWRRDILGTIVAGMVVLLVLRFTLGW